MAKRRKDSPSQDEVHEVDGHRLDQGKNKSLKIDNSNITETLSQSEELGETPTRRRRGRPPGSVNKPKPNPNGFAHDSATSSERKGRLLFAKTQKALRDGDPSKQLMPPPVRSDASLSIGKQDVKSRIRVPATNRIIHDQEEYEEDLLNKNLLEDDEDQSGPSQESEISNGGPNSPSPTPLKNPPPKRRKRRSPTPPQDLPAYERYFWQNRPGRVKTSNNILSSVSLLTHEQFHDSIANYKDRHAEAYESLYQIHITSFPQWHFELSQSFNVCLYGYGSKRRLVTEFAKFLYEHLSSAPQILIINGYNPSTSLRNVLITLATLVYDCKPNCLPTSLGSQPRDILHTLLTHLITNPLDRPIYILINSLDASPLRHPPTPTLLAQLAAHPSIHMLATCDTPNFPLLWNVTLREQYNWLFHDTTTFQSYNGAEIGSVIDEVNELLGRSGRSVKGKGGAGFVLKSLPENARSLYRVLIAEILTAVDDGDGDGVGGKEQEKLGGVERKALYQKVVEEFICSSEMGFGQLLNEFYDHDMLVDKRDVDGTRVLGVPWNREECEEILEELMG